jgi:hypothetical protein
LDNLEACVVVEDTSLCFAATSSIKVSLCRGGAPLASVEDITPFLVLVSGQDHILGSTETAMQAILIPIIHIRTSLVPPLVASTSTPCCCPQSIRNAIASNAFLELERTSAIIGP